MRACGRGHCCVSPTHTSPVCVVRIGLRFCFILGSTELPVWPMYTLPYSQGLLCLLGYLRPKSCLMGCSNPEIFRSGRILRFYSTPLMWLKVCWSTAGWLLSRDGSSVVLYYVADWERVGILSGCISCYETWTGIRMPQMDLALFAIVDSIESSLLGCAAVLRLSTDSCGSLSCTCRDPRSSLFFGRYQQRGKALISLKIFRYLCKYQQFSIPWFNRSVCNKSAQVWCRNNSTYTCIYCESRNRNTVIMLVLSWFKISLCLF